MRLIDADVLKKEVDNFPNCYNGWSDTYDKAYIIGAIEEQPSIDIEPKRGEWIEQEDDYHHYWECSECGMGVGLDDIRNYCPNCGADMRGDNDGKDIQSANE